MVTYCYLIRAPYDTIIIVCKAIFIPLHSFHLDPLLFSFPDYMCTVYVRSDSLAGVLISDQEYPDRISFTLLHKVGCFIDISMILYGSVTGIALFELPYLRFWTTSSVKFPSSNGRRVHPRKYNFEKFGAFLANLCMKLA